MSVDWTHVAQNIARKSTAYSQKFDTDFCEYGNE
jgi:hypothetical protein